MGNLASAGRMGNQQRRNEIEEESNDPIGHLASVSEIEEESNDPIGHLASVSYMQEFESAPMQQSSTPRTPQSASASVAVDHIVHDYTLRRLCYIPFDINTITVAPREAGVFDLVPLACGVAENSADMIQVEVSTGDNPFSLHHAVLVDGPFQLPEGYQLASHVVYLYSDPSQPVRPFILHLPHWYEQKQGQEPVDLEGQEGEEERGHGDGAQEGQEEGEEESGGSERDGLIFVKAPHTRSLVGGECLYKFRLLEGGNFHSSSAGSLLVNTHSTLFGLAYKEKSTSTLKYCATHLEREDTAGQQVDVAVTFATTTWQKILQKHRRPSKIKKATTFNFQTSLIVGKVQRVTGKKWKASLEGSAHIDKDEVSYRAHDIRSAKALESAVETGLYPPTLSFTVVYDTALKYNGHGRPSMVKFFCDGTTAGRLQFNSVVYEEMDQGGETSGTGSLSLKAVPSLMLLQDYIPQLADKWKVLGNALGLEHQVLSLQNDSRPPDTCLLSLLSAWVNAGDKEVGGVKVEVSWAFLVRVLRSPAVDKGSVASIIEAKYVGEN